MSHTYGLSSVGISEQAPNIDTVVFEGLVTLQNALIQSFLKTIDYYR